MKNSSRNSTSGKAKSNKPKKPYKKFPLGPAACGYWQKRINGKIFYFGAWGKRVKGELIQLPDGGAWREALAKYQAQAVDLHAGRTPRVTNTDDLNLADLCNRFLSAKQNKLNSGEIGTRMFDEYKATTDLLISQFGSNRLVDDLASDDFESLRTVMAERWGPNRLRNEITRAKTVFKYAYDSGLIKQAVRYGPEFVKPNKRVMRKHRAENGQKMLEADQLRQLLNAAKQPLKAMILLGVNCGFGNHDVACIPKSALNLETGWVDFARGKTGIERRCPLWPETVEAIQEAITARPELRQESAAGLVFLTARGRQWLTQGIANPVATHMTKLMKRIGVHKKGIGFYTLRHVFRTIADGCKDQVACNAIMGHSDSSMAGVYRERIDDSRLQAVVDHVHDWLFGSNDNGGNVEVTIEFDDGIERASKQFDNSHSAKRFYVVKDIEGRNPKVVIEEDQPTFKIVG